MARKGMVFIATIIIISTPLEGFGRQNMGGPNLPTNLVQTPYYAPGTLPSNFTTLGVPADPYNPQTIPVPEGLQTPKLF
jgi:hypothetical protein